MNRSIFEYLPDEILLEIYRYLLCSDILYSFMNLNQRITRTLAHYRRHLTFHKASIDRFHYISTTIIPQIGFQIRSLVIDCCYSVIQHPLFIEYFGKKMSLIFPNLERINLVSYQYDQLQAFLQTLHDLNSLVEIRLYSLFPIEENQQSSFARSLFQINNHRLTTILTDHHSSCFSFDENDRYLNIIQLHIQIKSLSYLPNLFSSVPNIQKLHLTIKETERLVDDFLGYQLALLVHLKDFQLLAFNRNWSFVELAHLLLRVPNIEIFSLFILTDDESLIHGEIVSSLLPITIQQFHYAVQYRSYMQIDTNDESFAASWSSYRIAYAQNDEYRFLHTIPWHFTHIDGLTLIDKLLTNEKNSMNGYKESVERVVMVLEKDLPCGQSLKILSQCRRVRELTIGFRKQPENKQTSVSFLPKLSRLRQIWIYGLLPSDLSFFSLILKSAPNLFRLDLSFENLLRIVEDEPICQLLSERITSLAIFSNEQNLSSSTTLNSEYMARIASYFPRIQDFYANILHLQIESCETVLISFLKEFQNHQLIGLCVDGNFSEQIKSNTDKWLREKTILNQKNFYAQFHNELDRLLIWL